MQFGDWGVEASEAIRVTDNDGLVVAEVELESEDQQFEKPNFIGEEVTGKVKYYNMMLLKNPYTTWGK